MTAITLGGYTIDELKAIRVAVAKDAQAFVAEELARAKGLFEKLRPMLEEIEEYGGKASEETQAIAKEANEAFAAVDLVASLGGVTYFVDYYEEYNDLDPASYHLDNAGYGYCYRKSERTALHDLYDTISGMEAQSQAWHSSTC